MELIDKEVGIELVNGEKDCWELTTGDFQEKLIFWREVFIEVLEKKIELHIYSDYVKCLSYGIELYKNGKTATLTYNAADLLKKNIEQIASCYYLSEWILHENTWMRTRKGKPITEGFYRTAMILSEEGHSSIWPGGGSKLRRIYTTNSAKVDAELKEYGHFWD